jgi:phospholipase C
MTCQTLPGIWCAAIRRLGAYENGSQTAAPINHLAVLCDENVSFDRCAGLSANALHPTGEPPFQARPGASSVSSLTEALPTDNPSQRLARFRALICDHDHPSTDEQKASGARLIDRFVQTVNGADPAIVIIHYDGYTVTALWNYARFFAVNDNSFGTSSGPSTPGALNLIAGRTYGAGPANVGFPLIFNGTGLQ